MQRIRNLILDMDGVLWRGNTPVPGLSSFFDTLNTLDIPFILATNNATKTQVQYVQKLAGFGVAVTEERILTSSVATASYLRTQHRSGTRVFVIGDEGLRHDLRSMGFHVLEDPDDLQQRPGQPEFRPAGLVVAGMSRSACYRDFALAAVHIRQGAAFFGTNPDVTFPSELGQLPGAGSIIALMETATDVKATVIGKPGPIMFEEALKRLGSEPRATAIVGDRLSTDIAGGRSAGIWTILVLSGISRREELAQSSIAPDYVLPDITAVASELRRFRAAE